MALNKEKLKKRTTIERVTSVTCDCCLKTTDKDSTGNKMEMNYGTAPCGFHYFQISGGYSSEFPQDGTTLEIVVCDDCLKAWVGQFKSKPVETNYF